MSTWGDFSGPSESFSPNGFYNKYFLPYVKTIDQSKKISSKAIKDIYPNGIKKPNGEVFISNTSGMPIFILQDGTVMSPAYVAMGNGKIYATHLWVDINGGKKPNVIGKDVFWFTLPLAKGVLAPSGLYELYWKTGEITKTYSRNECLANCKSDATECAALIYLDGWNIKDDYPYAL